MKLINWFIRLICCDKRWMVVYFDPYPPQVHLVRHYLGNPSWGWEMFEMIGPFESESAANRYIEETKGH